MDPLSIILLILLISALLAACAGKFGPYPLIATIVALLVLVIERVIKK